MSWRLAALLIAVCVAVAHAEPRVPVPAWERESFNEDFFEPQPLRLWTFGTATTTSALMIAASPGIICRIDVAGLTLEDHSYQRGDSYKASSCAEYRAVVEKAVTPGTFSYTGNAAAVCWLLDPCSKP